MLGGEFFCKKIIEKLLTLRKKSCKINFAVTDKKLWNSKNKIKKLLTEN